MSELTLKDIACARQKLLEAGGDTNMHFVIPGWAVPTMKEKGFDVQYADTLLGNKPFVIMTEGEVAELMALQGRWAQEEKRD